MTPEQPSWEFVSEDRPHQIPSGDYECASVRWGRVVATSWDPEGPFDDVAFGSRMFWRGMVTEFIGAFPFEFKATLHIQPTR